LLAFPIALPRPRLKANQMTKLEDKVAGKVKQAVAEFAGDGKLREEGKQQEEKAKEKPNELNPFTDLNQLT
jgi:uncharacterized protein YjbJ (UPF0337 family)